jgi:hypothetical protein
MAYKLGTTTVIDDSALIPWARISGAPAIPTASEIMATVAAAAYGAVGTQSMPIATAPASPKARSMLDRASTRQGTNTSIRPPRTAPTIF